MSIVWIICGAGRRVGKTTLAQKLCEVLPNSVYAKCGHGKRKKAKPANFFSTIKRLRQFIEARQKLNKHVVVESNSFALLDSADITIFIDGISGKTHFRKDSEQLRSGADIVINSMALASGWKGKLEGRLKSSELCRAVCKCLAEQKQYLFSSDTEVRSKVWFEAAGIHIFGRGLATLLENIDHLGTLQEAAKAANMSYRYAWNLIHAAEAHLGKKIVLRHCGGREGGHSALSVQGRHLLDVFKKLNNEVANFTNERFGELYNKEKINA